MAETDLTGDWEAALKRLVHLPDRLLKAMQQATQENAVFLVGATKEYILAQKGFTKLHPFTIAQRAAGGGKHGEAKRLVDHGDLIAAIGFQMAQDGLSARVGVFNNARNDDGVSIAMIARIQTDGCVISVTEKMRLWLHVHGLHLKRETTHIIIPATPFIEPAFEANREAIKDRYRERFMSAFKGGG